MLPAARVAILLEAMMPQPDTEQPTAEQQAQAAGIRTYLHDQADQLGEEAE